MSKEPTTKALLDRLTEEELDLFAFLRSGAWCGTNWEDKERFRIERILEARNPTPIMKQHPLKKLFHFLFS